VIQRISVFGVSVLALALAQRALAEGTVESVVSIEYRAPTECPGRAEFLGQVLRRLPHIRIEGAAENRRAFEVDVEPAAERTVARLKFLDADSRRVERELKAPSCEEAVAGIALITALAIDPRLSIAEPSDGAGAPLEPGASPTKPQPSPAVTTPTTPVRPAADDSPSRPSEPERRGWAWLLGAAVGPVSDVAPSWTPSGLIFSEIGPWSDVRVRLALGYADTGERELQGGLVRFRLAHGRSEICPVALAAGSRVTLRPCAALELGMLMAEGAESPRLVEPKSSSDLWFAGVGALRVELRLGRVVSLELDGQLRMPLLRRTYVFERPEAPVYDTPRVGGGFLLGAKARISK
jgi:hypothetical protein